MATKRKRRQRSIGWLAAASSLVACFAIAFAVLPGAAAHDEMPAAISSYSISTDSNGGQQEVETKDDARHNETLTWSNGAPYRASEALVRLADGVTADELNARLATLDYVTTTSIDKGDVALGWVKLALASETDVADAMTQLEELGCIESAQPNFVYHLMDDNSPSTSDPSAQVQATQVEAADSTSQLKANLPALKATSLQAQADDDDYWHLGAIGAQTAWKSQKTSHAVTVAVVDTGCDVTHPDLKENIVASCSVLDGTRNVTDNNGHGTHTAGIIAAVPNNGIGVAGVSYNAGLLPIKVMDDDETDSISLVKAYQYILQNATRYRIRVVNMSLGARQVGLSVYDEATLRAIDQAHRAGILSVFAAGNEGSKAPYYCFPCDFSENGVGVINVGKDYNAGAAAPNNGLPDSSSNYNKRLEMTKDLSAPGVDITSTFPDGRYRMKTGTSMASPVVAGVAALVFARNPALSAGEVKSVLCSTAQDLVHRSFSGVSNVGFDDYTGYGLVRADLAVAGSSARYLTGGDSLAKGSTLKLTVPAGAPSGSWKWASNRPSVASVNPATGEVKGVAHGEAAISATNGSVTLYRTIAVYETSITGPNSLRVGSSSTVRAAANPVAMWTYHSSNPKIATVGSASGLVTGKKGGKVTITARLTACPSITASKTVRITPAKNPIKVSTTTERISQSQVKHGSKTVRCLSVKKARGTVTYSLVKSRSSQALSINKKTGKITVKKGAKRGTLVAKVKVRASGNASYKPATKTVKATIVVR